MASRNKFQIGRRKAIGKFSKLAGAALFTPNLFNIAKAAGFLVHPQTIPIATAGAVSIAFVQSKAVGGGTASTAYNSNNTAGNFLIAFINTNGTANIPTDTRGNTWVDSGLGAVLYQAGTASTRVCYVLNCAAGANTVTSTSAFSLHLYEFSGVKTSAATDGANSSGNNAVSASGTDNMTGGAITTTANGDLIFASAACLNGPLSAGTGFTSPNGDVSGLSEYQIQGTAGAITSHITDGSVADTYAMISAAFKHA